MASNTLLGLPGELYEPAPLWYRGMSIAARGDPVSHIDTYLVDPNGAGLNVLMVDMQGTAGAGDWIRVVTAVPEPGSCLFLGGFLAALVMKRRRK